MKKIKQLKQYSCSRHGIRDFIFTRSNHMEAAKQLKAAPTYVTATFAELGSFEEGKIYRNTGSCIIEPKFNYESSKQSRSPNSIHYYTCRGWSEEEANILIAHHRKTHIGKESEKYDSEKRSWHPKFWEKFGLVGDEAIAMAQEFQKKSLKYFKFRYGNEEGSIRFNKCVKNRQLGFDRRRDTEIQNIMKMGEVDYDQAVEAYRHRRVVVSPRRIEYWTARGFSTSEAVARVKQWQSEMSPRTVHHWVNSGYSLDQAQKKVADFQARNTVQSIMKRYDCTEEIAYEIQQHFYDKGTETKKEREIIRDDRTQIEYLMYDRVVRMATNRIYRRFKSEIDPQNLRSPQNQLDHKYPVLLGFENNVPVCIMACKHNLEIMSAKLNRQKGTTPTIKLEELIELYEKSL